MRRSAILLFLAIFCAMSPVTSVRAGDPEILEITITGEDEVHANQIKRIIPLCIGDPLTITNMARAASLLKKTGLYKEILIIYEQPPNTEGVVVMIDLVPHRFIRKVHFKGDFPIFESEVRSAVRVREGRAYDPEMIDEDVKRLEAFLQKEGYFESEVLIEEEPDYKTGDVIITFKILKKGSRYIVRKVTADGNDNLSSSSISMIVRKIMLLRYNKDRINKAIEAITARYHEEGFYEARVKVESIELDPGTRSVVLNLSIMEGPWAKVVIKGNSRIMERRLRKELTFGEQKSIDKYEIAAGAEKIADLYRSRGYRYVKVTFEVSNKVEKDKIFKEILYRIDEGPRVKVKKVEFRGANSFERKKIRKQMLTGRRRSVGRTSLLVDKVLADDIAAIEAFYKSWGYEEARVSTYKVVIKDKDRSRARVVIEIDEGTETIVRELKFHGVEFFPLDECPKMVEFAKLKLVEGAPLDRSALTEDKRKLLVFYADHGFPYAKISQKVVALDGPGKKEVAIHYVVQEGKRVEVGEVIIRGNYKTKGRVFTRELELFSGEPFSYTGLMESNRNLRTLPFLYTAKLETLGFEEKMDVVHLLLNVRERPAESVDFGVGYDSDLGPNAWIELTTLNLLGYGKTGRLMLMGGGDINKAEAQYIDPRFLGSRLRADAITTWSYEEHPTFNLTQVAGTFSLTRKFPYHITGSIASRMEWNKLTSVDIQHIDEITIEENTILGVGPILLYDTRDDFIDPTTGWFNRVMIEYIEEFSNGETFVKAEAQAARFFTITGDVVLGASLLIGHIEPLHSSEVPLQEVFFVGGNRSVRGFSEDGLGPHLPDGSAIGGLDKIVTNLELRFPIWSLFHGVLFIDSGQLVSDPAEYEVDMQLFTVGTGLRLMTPVGPVRVDYGYKLEPVWWEKRTRWHLSFGYPF